MKIERMLELMADFKTNGIRNSGKTGLDKVIEFQDIIGRSTMDEIADAWKTLDPSQRIIFIWSISCCLAPEMVTSIIMETVGRDTRRKIRDQFDALDEELANRELAIGERENALNKREAELRKTVDAQVKIQDILNELRR